MGRARAGRCVVVSSLPDEAADLLAGLARRGMVAKVVTDAPSVMVDLARAEAAALILVDVLPSSQRAQLLEAMRLYHPRTGCWEYRREWGEPVGRLVKIDSAAARMFEPARDLEPRPARNERPVASRKIQAQSPQLHEHPFINSPRTPSGGIAAIDVDDEPLVSADELAMLLEQGAGQEHG